MEQQQFRELKSQLRFLTSSQLREVQRLIKSASLEHEVVPLSEEERQFIHNLFTKEPSTPSYS
ncbi:hypothetical protein [Vibrio sp. M260121]|uniref:hypothetical protein n=1 Tax=Vibrio sp. M260121 TaxID=3020897 RepID=UPI002F414BCC